MEFFKKWWWLLLLVLLLIIGGVFLLTSKTPKVSGSANVKAPAYQGQSKMEAGKG